MSRFIDVVLKQYKFVIIFTLLLTVALGYCIRHISLNNTVDMNFEKDDPLVTVYYEFRETFGNEEAAVVLFKDDDIFSNEKIRIIRAISQMANDLAFVHRVFSITEQDEAVSDGDFLSFRKVIPEGTLDDKSLKAVRERVLKNKILLDRFISRDGKTVAIVIELEFMENSRDKIHLLKDLKKKATEIAGNQVDLHFTGLPFVESEQNVLMIKDFFTITPLMFIIIIILVQVCLRSYTMNWFSFLTINISATMAVGLFVLAGQSVNIVTSIMPPVLLAIAIADMIHLLAHYIDERTLVGRNHFDAVAYTTKAVWLPCLFTSITTAVGFLSFLTASVKPVKTLGIFTAVGVMIAFILTITFLPALLIFFRKKFEGPGAEYLKHSNVENRKEGLLLPFVLKLGKFSTTYIKSITALFIFLVILTGYGTTKIQFETNVTKFFDEDSSIIQDLKFIEKNMGGYLNSELLIRATSAKFDFTHPDSLKLITEIQEYIKEDWDVSSSISIADYLMEINSAFNNNDILFHKVPDTKDTILDYYELGDVDDIDRLVSPDRMQARISYQVFNMTTEKGKRRLKEISGYMDKKLGDKFTYDITGSGMLWMNMDENLKQSFIKSLLFAFVIIYGMMLFICKDFKLSVLSMIPNLFPICMTVGIMGWFQIPFNTITVMIACVTLGIAVDDTVHFLVWFRRNSLAGMDTKPALLAAFKDVGKPIFITSVILSLGFFILVFGSYRPSGTFGMLTALTIFFALFSDLIILPAILLVVDSFGKKKSNRFVSHEKKIKGLAEDN